MNNLLSLLTGSFTNDNSLSTISGKTGLSSKQIRTILLYAMPLLIKYLAKNASQKKGEDSLAAALTQHRSNEPVALQIKNADTTDGEKIIGHILGNHSQEVISGAAKETGASQKDVAAVLNMIAPALLNSVSSASSATSSQGLNLSTMMNMFAGGGSSKHQSDLLASVLTSLFK